MPLVNTTCLKCNKEFQVLQAEINRGNGKYCSRKCSANRKKRPKPHNAQCAYCLKTFYRKPFSLTLSKSGLHFCTRLCKDKAQCLYDGLLNFDVPHAKNGLCSYRERANRNYEYRCNICGYNEYPILEVHHKDGNRDNNHQDNLTYLCPNCHTIEHRGLRKT